jgi:TolB protein
MKLHIPLATAAVVLSAGALAATGAQADVFNGRIAFSSFRVDPQPGATRTGDIFSLNPDGTDLRRLTDNPEDDAQSEWSPDGTDLVYRIRKPGFRINFEVSRMTAAGEGHQRLTFTPDGQASSQPSWFPDKSAVLFRRSGPGLIASVWQMGPLGEDPSVRYDPPGPQWYPTLSPDGSTVLFATTMSPTGDADRAIQTLNADGTGLTTLWDIVGTYESAPAWSPDGARIAFESNANPFGANPEGDLEIWVMDADGTHAAQITSNALRDEGPAWSPDGTLLAYSSGADDTHLDINVMTPAGVQVRQLTDYAGRDESPDWQPIPAPATDRRCGPLAESGPGVHDVRAAGDRLSCRKARALAREWSEEAADDGGVPTRVEGFDADTTDFGGTLRVVLSHRGNRDGDGGNDKLVAFLYEPGPAAAPDPDEPGGDR